MSLLSDIPYVGPPDKFSQGDNTPIKRIVIHCTVSPCEVGGARNIAAFFRSDAAGGSAHFVVDPGEAVRVARDNVICWHAPPNSHSLGVELCDPMSGSESSQTNGDRWDDGKHRSMLELAAGLVAALCAKHGIPAERLTVDELRGNESGVCGHDDVSDAFHQSSHWDPGTHFPWRRFMRMVKAASGADSPEDTGLTREQKVRLRALKADALKRIDELDASLDAAQERVGTVKGKLAEAQNRVDRVVEKLAE